VPVKDLPQDPFARSAAELEVERQAPGKGDHLRIEQRHARFERNGHGGAVDLRKHVVGQIAEHVTRHHSLHVVEAAQIVRQCS